MKSLKDILPWEERPEGCKDVMWRYSKNPIIDRYHIPTSNSIFNSAVVPFEDGFAGVFRCDNKAVQMNIFAGFSKDGVNWEINHEPIKFEAGNTEMIESEYKYDPRVTWIEDRYWILGVTVITDQQSVLLTPSTSRSSISVRMLSCHSIVMASSSQRRSMESMLC